MKKNWECNDMFKCGLLNGNIEMFSLLILMRHFSPLYVCFAGNTILHYGEKFNGAPLNHLKKIVCNSNNIKIKIKGEKNDNYRSV